ncbi:unnamed protein product [Prorocentrum cordatum]|uniref:Uncharacterized protein n=1 Tax=Prorocentrum cordatum TaxID=2364126 RepID=A0ABN9UZB8_9DINO|nr:unnamed protein product [Polarella glacialis]
MKRSVAGTRPRDDGACGGIAPGWPVAALGDAERGWRGQDGGKGGEEGRSVRGWRPATTGLPRGRRSVACRMMPPETRRRRTIIFCTGSDGLDATPDFVVKGRGRRRRRRRRRNIHHCVTNESEPGSTRRHMHNLKCLCVARGCRIRRRISGPQ